MDLASLFGRNINGWQLGQGLTNAPTLNMNAPGGANAFQTMMSNGGAGRLDNGIAAFMPKDWSEPMVTSNSGAEGDTSYNTQPFQNSVRHLASQFGQQPAGGGWESTPQRRALMASVQPNGFNAQYNGLNNSLKDIWKVSGLSQGWDGKNNERGASSTLYHNNGGIWNPISQSQHYIQPRKGPWIKDEGAEFVAAASMMLPMVGGWAGLANTVAPSVTSGIASGIGNAATNTLFNTLGNSLMTGSFNPLSAATGSLGSMFGGGNVPLGGGSNFNSLGQLMGSGTGAAIRNSAPMRGEMGQLFNTGRSLASLFGRLT